MYSVFVDGSCNLPQAKLKGLEILPCTYTVDGEVKVYRGELDSFDVHGYYEGLRTGRKVKTSLVNMETCLRCFRPVLEEGKDVIYIAMSSNISGTYQAAVLAARELKEIFPQRGVHIVDARGCGLGIGLLALRGKRYREEGKSFEETCRLLDETVPHICQYFTVDDLNFLKSTGRVSSAVAIVGTMLNIKPVLYGTSDGYIVSAGKCRGRKKAIETIAQTYAQKALNVGSEIVGISHGDCEADAKELARQICAIATPKELIVCPHEPFSGAHVGPGMLALFFYGRER